MMRLKNLLKNMMSFGYRLCVVLVASVVIFKNASAANIGYVWFSQQSYCDKYNAAEHNFVTMLENVNPVNSIIDIPKGTIFYPSLDTIIKINNDYKNFYKQKENGCDAMGTGFASYYMINDDPKCSIKHVNLQKHKDYHEFYSEDAVKHDNGVIKYPKPLTYYKAQVLGYVFFECGMQFVLVQSY